MLLPGMQFAELEQFEHRQKIGDNLIARYIVGQHVAEKHRTLFQSCGQIEYALFDAESVAGNRAEYAPRLIILMRLPRKDALQRTHKPIQR